MADESFDIRDLLPPGSLSPSVMHRDDESWMREALREAVAAYDIDEVPVGAIVVHMPTGRIIGRGHNLREQLKDPTAHAEVLALTAAAGAVGHWRLDDCMLVVTLEPCPMCAGACVNARLGRLVYGATDPKAGACGTLYNIHDDLRLNHRIPTTAGVLADECALVLREFFKQKRKGPANPPQPRT